MAEPLQLIIYPWLKAFDRNGAALAGGKAYTYEAGTTTPLVTYSDPAQTIPNTNPIVLDSEGQAPLYITGPWKLVVTDAADVQIRTHDNLVGVNGEVLALVSGVYPNPITKALIFG